ncbi:MAG: Uma2 family endonuclease [Staphylococcus hominis]|nr:MAG: Uma2 family endonuclease [Staphylococcus hominis]
MGVEDAIGGETELRRYALTVEDFLRLDEAGAFAEVGRVELIDGEIFELSPVYSQHAYVLSRTISSLQSAVDAGQVDAAVLSPVSLKIDEHNLPLPDVLVAPLPQGNVPIDADMVLIAVEVSSSTLRHDLVRKALIYSRRGIPEYWVIDVAGRQLHQLTDPMPEGYATRDVVPFGARVVSKKVPEIALDTSAFG